MKAEEIEWFRRGQPRRGRLVAFVFPPLILSAATHLDHSQIPSGVSSGQSQSWTLSATPSTATLACPSNACRARIGEKVFGFPPTSTVSNLSGTGALSTIWFYVDKNGNLIAGFDGTGVTGATFAGIGSATGIQNYPPDCLPIGRCAVNGNRFQTCTDDQAQLQRAVIDPGSGGGIIVIQNPVTGHTGIAADPSRLAFFGAPNTWLNVQDLSNAVFIPPFGPTDPATCQGWFFNVTTNTLTLCVNGVRHVIPTN